MARNVDSNGVTLKKRLDNLEDELKILHEKILQRKLKKCALAGTTQVETNKSVALVKGNAASNWWGSSNQEGRDWFNCLKSITRSIAQGSDAIRKIASLTDVTSISGTLSSLLPANTDRDSIKIKSTQSTNVSVKNNNHGNNGGKNFVCFNVKTASPVGAGAGFSAATDSMMTTGVSLSRSEGEMSLFQSRFRPPISSRSVQDCKKTLLRENHRLKQQIAVSKELKKEVQELKKKLKVEMKRRYTAEEKAANVLQEAAGLGTKQFICKEKEYDNNWTNTNNFVAGDQTKLLPSDDCPAETQRSSIEKEFSFEKEQRMKLEQLIAHLQDSLKAKNKKVEELTTGQKLALALAEQFRAQCEKSEEDELAKGDFYLRKALKESNTKCCVLQEELAKVKSQLELNCSNENFRERALKAEAELQTMQKQLNENSLDASQLQCALSKQEKSYYELLLSKKCSEAEYKARCRQLEGEMGKLHTYYEKRIEMLNDKVKDVMLQLQEKVISIENITKIKDNCDAASYKGMMSAIGDQLKQKDTVMTSFKEMLDQNEELRKAAEEEKCRALLELNRMQGDVIQYQTELEEKDKQLNLLLSQLSQKSDELAVKGKILTDHTETINGLRKRLTDLSKEREVIIGAKKDLTIEVEALRAESNRLKTTLDQVSTTMSEVTKYKQGQEKNFILLKHLEKQVYERQKQWDQQLSAMNKEKEHAVQTAKFATQKLISAVGEYESQLKSRKQLEQTLTASLAEKEEKLQQIQRDVQRIAGEAAAAENKAEFLKRDFQKKFNRICKVCADVIDQVPDGTSEYT